MSIVTYCERLITPWHPSRASDLEPCNMPMPCALHPSMCRECMQRRNALIEESEIALEYHRGDEAKRLAALARDVRCEHADRGAA